MNYVEYSRSDRWRPLLDKLWGGLGATATVLALAGCSEQAASTGSDLPYDLPQVPPIVEFDDTPTVRSPLAVEMEGRSGNPSSSVEEEDEPEPACVEGTPVAFSWPDFGIDNVDVEPVGIDEVADSIAAPTGKNAAGGYNTVGWYMYGPKPGAADGTPVFLAHRTLYSKSLLDKNFANDMKDIRDSGESTSFSVELDNGSTCTYEVSKQTGIWPRLDKKRDYSPWFIDAYDHGPGHKGTTNGLVLFVTCAGDFNPDMGTSDSSTTFMGSQKK